MKAPPTEDGEPGSSVFKPLNDLYILIRFLGPKASENAVTLNCFSLEDHNHVIQPLVETGRPLKAES